MQPISRRSFLGFLGGAFTAACAILGLRSSGAKLAAMSEDAAKPEIPWKSPIEVHHPRGRVTHVQYRSEWRELHVFTETDMWRVYPPDNMLFSDMLAALRKEGFGIHDAQVLAATRPEPYACRSDAAKRMFLGRLT